MVGFYDAWERNESKRTPNWECDKSRDKNA